jgi:hypothetical protein
MAFELDQMTPTELQLFCLLLMSEADKLPKGDPKKARLLLAAQQLLDRASPISAPEARRR